MIIIKKSPISTRNIFLNGSCALAIHRKEEYGPSHLPLPPTHEHSDIYLQFRIWDDNCTFLITSHVISRLPVD